MTSDSFDGITLQIGLISLDTSSKIPISQILYNANSLSSFKILGIKALSMADVLLVLSLDDFVYLATICASNSKMTLV
jgi:hypothetical protein